MRKIIITGASRGIGKSIAKRLLSDGHQVSIGLRDKGAWQDSLSNRKIRSSNKLLICKYDALNMTSPRKLIKKTINKFGGIDTIIHCAGIFKRTGFFITKDEYADLECLWRTNAIGPWLLTQEAWKYLSENGKGRIIVLVSMSGIRSKSNLAGYSMSKFALMSLCQTMRNEGWNQGIRVTAICPGWVNTDMSKGIKNFPRTEMTQPKDISSICSTLLNLDNSCVPFELCINCNLENN